ncbi:glycosyltransferase [Paenibacillus contaminans]|uniref:Glycosyltransferase family 2 protein n=1 Tax=Paenibacillus contaminans TaxID=450362 RepID=A0A329LN59_9BACL|nr:glycosyltransferase [Paenibacillus contaminans]RAV08660.1 glycosyltransferase family 2 protein [Paenibacillus contaminans]
MTYKVVVGVPVYNEYPALARLLDKLVALKERLHVPLRVLVVNDGSTDRTEAVLRKYADEHSFIAYENHETNRGLGAAIHTLFARVTEQFAAEDILITIDGDNTHHPRFIPGMVRQLQSQNLDLVIASRFAAGGKEKGVSLTRKLCSRGAKAYFKLFFPIAGVSDYSSGYRGYRIGYLQQAMAAYEGKLVTTEGFACMAEIIAKFSRLGVKAGEYPLVLDYHLKQGRSKMNVAKTVRGYLALLQNVPKYESPARVKRGKR